MNEQLENAVRVFLDLGVEGDVAGSVESLADDALYHLNSWNAPFVGRDAIRKDFERQRTLWSDFRYELLKIATRDNIVFTERIDTVRVDDRDVSIHVVGVTSATSAIARADGSASSASAAARILSSLPQSSWCSPLNRRLNASPSAPEVTGRGPPIETINGQDRVGRFGRSSGTGRPDRDPDAAAHGRSRQCESGFQPSDTSEPGHDRARLQPPV